MFAGALLLAASCYEPYITDYTYSTVYNAFQYDLRTFVVGEGEQFEYTVALAGVLDNTADRNVSVSICDDLVTASIPELIGVDAASFTAYDGLSGKGKFGTVSQSYVSDEVKALGVTAMEPLPSSCYTVSGLDGMKIEKGKWTAKATVKATDEFINNPKAIKPYYAIGFKIESAQADTIPLQKSFEVIAVKIENKYYGNWYHGGKTTVVDNVTGQIIPERCEDYSLVLPQPDDKAYILTTVAPDEVVTNKIGSKSGELHLKFDGENITLSVPDPTLKISCGACYSNGAKLLQDRKIYLNYSYDNGDGTSSFVSDELTFRNRIRDGVNEWQDLNPENYK